MSVQNRMVSDRPLGAFLSGGIDSSLVCALAARHSEGPLKTFTMGWEDREYDESRQAAAVASALGSEHHDVRLGRSDVVTATQRLGSVMDEPFADSSLLAVLLVASQARKHVVVALSGDGGDELFAGYNRHRWLLRVARAHRSVPRALLNGSGRAATALAPIVERLLSPIPPTRRPRLVADKVRKLATALAASGVESAYQSLIAQDTSFGCERPLPSAVTSCMGSGEDAEVLWALRVADLTGYLPDDVLTKVDRATMAVSLESRTPFLNSDVAALALAMGPRDLIGSDGGKQPLRLLLRRLLPDVDFSQTKAGFGVPFISLMRQELRDLLGDAVETHVRRTPPVGPVWPVLFSRFQEGDDVPATLLWTLLMFEMWANEQPSTLTWA